MPLLASAWGDIFLLVFLAIWLVIIVAGWKLFTKADQPGWAVLIPIYNIIVFLRVVGRPWWWLLLFWVPGIGTALQVIVLLDLAKSFRRSMWFGIWLNLIGFILVPVIAYGESIYHGPAGKEQWPTADAPEYGELAR